MSSGASLRDTSARDVHHAHVTHTKCDSAPIQNSDLRALPRSADIPIFVQREKTFGFWATKFNIFLNKISTFNGLLS